ncbi:MAG TPA: elongation factor P [Candidatus Paceibacterota bacterium]|jgi:elongation factor P
MLSYNEITLKKYVVLDNEPFEVLASHVFRKQQRKPVNQTKLRSLLSGRVVERTFHQSETIPEADISKIDIMYLYSHRGEHWFCDPADPKSRFKLTESIVKDTPKYAKQNSIVSALRFGEDIVGVEPPIKVALLVKEAPPGVRGNTAQGGTKQVVLETGATTNVPLFIEEGDVVRVNTETGAYVERVEKA